MTVARVALVLVCFAACGTKQNPAATCTDNGMCSDPAFPYCDVDGAIAGQPGACIAAECAAGSFGTCDGSNALFCDATGEGYDPMPCANGCAPASGCITCTANSESCANNVDSKCDANGTLTTTPCSVGCNATGNGCSIPVPSNGLETYIDMTSAPADLDLEDGILELDGATFTSNVDGSMTTLPSFDVTAPADGAPIRVFVVGKLTLGNITVRSTTANTNSGVGRAVAFLATGAITVAGDVRVETGAVSKAGCNGGAGGNGTIQNIDYGGGGGGGGNATSGAAGGSITGTAMGGVAGLASGNQTLVPLAGGCPGGLSDPAHPLAGGGGGAIQLMSRAAIQVTGAIIVDGGSFLDGGGGGAGGGILLEAPMVDVSGTALLLARGGGGGAGNEPGPTPPLDGSSPPGGTCVGGLDVTCEDGGKGAPAPAPGTPLAKLPPNPVNPEAVLPGGGGGGLGRIRVNTGDGTFTPAASSIVVADTTNGTMLTD